MRSEVYIEDRPTTDQRPLRPHIWEISNGHNYLHEGSSDPRHVWFYGGVFGVGGSNGANTGKPRDAASVTRSKFNVLPNDMLPLGNHAMQRGSLTTSKFKV